MNIFLKSSTPLSSLSLIYYGQVVHENAPFRGVTHLAEHLMSYGVRDLEAKYFKYGVNSNAYTSPLVVNYYLQGLDRYLHRFADEFIRRITTYVPTLEIFERERKVVLEEYKDCFTDQISAFCCNQSRKNYEYCGPIGYREDLENLTYEQYLDYQKSAFCHPDKLIYVGKREFKADLDFASGNAERDFKLREKSQLKIEEVSKFDEKTVIDLHAPLAAGELPYAKFAKVLLAGGMDSPLFKMVREKYALAYFVQSAVSNFSSNYATFDIFTQVSNANKDFCFEVIQSVLNQPERYITKKRFNDLLCSFKISLEKEEIERYINISRYIVPYESTIDYIIEHKLLTYEAVIDFLKNKSDKFHYFTDKP